MTSANVAVKLPTPARVRYDGREVLVRTVLVPAKMAPFLHGTQVARELADAGTLEPGNLVQWGKLAVETVDADQEAISVAFSQREQTIFGEIKRGFSAPSDQTLLQGAYDLSATLLATHERKDGEPYPTHPVDVAWIVYNNFDIKGRVDLMVSALCHDLLEDVTIADLERLDVGTRVALFGEAGAAAIALMISQKDSAGEEQTQAAVTTLMRTTIESKFGAQVLDTVSRLSRGNLSSAAYMKQVTESDDAAIIKCADTFTNAGTLYMLVDKFEVGKGQIVEPKRMKGIDLRGYLTHKYYAEIQDSLLPWAKARGYTGIEQTFTDWLGNGLTLLDLQRWIINNPDAEPVFMCLCLTRE